MKEHSLRNLLLIEDHEDTANLMARMLRSSFNITIATTQKRALHELDSRTFDAILSDISLSDGSGLTIMREVRRGRLNTDTPAIALSGHGFSEDIQASIDAGFNKHLLKPLDFTFLVSTLHHLTRRSDATAEGESSPASLGD